MGLPVQVLPGLEEGQVRLRLGEGVQAHGVLDGHEAATLGLEGGKEEAQAAQGGGVAASDGAYLPKLPFQELHPVVLP